METVKVAANIKASVLWLAVFGQWCERTSWCTRQQPATYPSSHHPHHLMSLVLPVVTALLICCV